MGRTIVIILLIGLAFWGLRRLWRKLDAPSQPAPEQVFEKTVRCAECGVHVSTRLALERDGKHYCCRDHLPPA